MKLLSRFKLGPIEPSHVHINRGRKPKTPVQGVIDPVCGMAVDPEATPHHTSLDGRDYYFCSHACRLDFEEDPAAYLPGDAEAAG